MASSSREVFAYLLVFQRPYSTEKHCKAALEKARWPDAFINY
jgi:hypothetical protein